MIRLGRIIWIRVSSRGLRWGSRLSVVSSQVSGMVWVDVEDLEPVGGGVGEVVGWGVGEGVGF